jgi:hypothetical protein
MRFKYDGHVLKFDKELSDLDKLVFDFIGLLKKSGTKYVIVSGYVAILLGRSRTTEDIDIYIGRTGLKNFAKLYNLLVRNNYWLVDSDSLEDAFDRLEKGLSIRAAKKDTVVPNFEVKFAKKETDFMSFDNPVNALINGRKLAISPIEIQIPYKVLLGSEKDIEDAVHMYELFKEKLDRAKMRSIAKGLKVENKMIKHGLV